jgi:hypothetical protein
MDLSIVAAASGILRDMVEDIKRVKRERGQEQARR